MSLSTLVDLLVPPASLALFALLALVLWRRRGRVLAIMLLTPLVLLGLPVVSMPLLASLNLPEGAGEGAPEAIVILSADVDRTGVPGGTDLGALTLERERAGAALHRRTGLPVLVTGGLVTAPPPVGLLMAQSLPQDFGIPVRWVEYRSLTTWENAQFSAPMLKADGIGRAYVVTHAWHMRRALVAFQRAGMEVRPATVRPDPWPQFVLSEFFPRVSSWSRSYLALHEWVGLLQYMLRP